MCTTQTTIIYSKLNAYSPYTTVEHIKYIL